VAILQSKAQRMGIQVEPEVLSLVAQRVDSNIRELEGALNHLFLQAQMSRTQLDLAMASSTLVQVAPYRKPCDPARLIEIVAKHLHLLADDMTGARRTKAIADARHLAMYLLREDSALSLPQIGALFGGRDHSTVAHGVAKITAELRRDEQLRATVAALRERIYS
jgi:chromosomal replication initiator protein